MVIMMMMMIMNEWMSDGCDWTMISFYLQQQKPVSLPGLAGWMSQWWLFDDSWWSGATLMMGTVCCFFALRTGTGMVGVWSRLRYRRTL
jgi:hypothetical protein